MHQLALPIYKAESHMTDKTACLRLHHSDGGRHLAGQPDIILITIGYVFAICRHRQLLKGLGRTMIGPVLQQPKGKSGDIFCQKLSTACICRAVIPYQ